jgi:hypothetical protein
MLRFARISFPNLRALIDEKDERTSHLHFEDMHIGPFANQAWTMTPLQSFFVALF